MSTEAQQVANRLNALKSTGPKSEAGKARSAQNSIKHGMLAKHVVILEESRESFEELHQSLREEWRPSNMTQRILVERIATHQWKLIRVEASESKMYMMELRKQRVDVKEYAKTGLPAGIKGSYALIDIINHENSCSFLLLQQYEQREERAMQSCIRQMMALKKFEKQMGKSEEQESEDPSPNLSPGTERGVRQASPDLPRSTARDEANEANSVEMTRKKAILDAVKATMAQYHALGASETPRVARELARGGPLVTT